MYLNKFRKSEQLKYKELNFVNENYISIVPELSLPKTTDMYTAFLFSEYPDN